MVINGLRIARTNFGLDKLVNDVVLMAEKKCSITCGILDFNKKFADIVEEKALNGVEFIIISSKTAKLKYYGNPLLDLLGKGSKDMRLYNNLSLFYEVDGWPVLHYITVDDKFALVEACHVENDKVRNAILFTDRKTNKALDSKTHYDIGLRSIIQADKSSDYIGYLTDPSEEAQKNAVERAGPDHFGWIRSTVMTEIKNYEIREENFRKLTEGFGK